MKVILKKGDDYTLGIVNAMIESERYSWKKVEEELQLIQYWLKYADVEIDKEMAKMIKRYNCR